MIYWIFRAAFIVIFKLLFRLKVEGLENLPQKTNFIVISNHASFLDPLIIGTAIPKRIYWLAFRDIYNFFWLRWFMKIADVLPTGNSSEKALHLLNNNKNIGLFPEGTRSFDGQLKEFRRGVALLALKTGRPILPCAILGAYDALPKSAKFPRFLPIKVKIGKPKYLLKQFEAVIDDVYLQEGVFKLKEAIKGMLDAG
jgi:1-acyl-sn-glycerol-3-phosphate acyltransferase